MGCVAVPQVFALPSIFFWMLGCATAESSPPQNRTRDGASDCTVVIAYPLPHGRILETLILGFAGDERSFLSPPEAPILCPSRKSVNSVSQGRVEKRRKSLLSFIIWAGLRPRSAPPLSSTHWGATFRRPSRRSFLIESCALFISFPHFAYKIATCFYKAKNERMDEKMANKNNNEVLHPYYVILSRDTRFDDDRRPAPDFIRLMDADEAISSN